MISAPGAPETQEAEFRVRSEGLPLSQALPSKSNVRDNPKPLCYDALLARVNHSASKQFDKRDQKKAREISGRFMSTLFMPTVDTEFVAEMFDHFDMDQCAEEAVANKQEAEAKKAATKVDEEDPSDHLVLDSMGQDITRGVKEGRETPLNYLNTHMRLTNPLDVMPRDRNGQQQEASFRLPKLSEAVYRSQRNKDNNNMDADMSVLTADGASEEEASVISLPSVREGNTVSLPAAAAKIYFGKKARSDFFLTYRSMSDTKVSFSRPIMSKNEQEDVWESVRTLDEENLAHRQARHQGTRTPNMKGINPGERSGSRSPSPINVLLGGAEMAEAALTGRSHRSSSSPSSGSFGEGRPGHKASGITPASDMDSTAQDANTSNDWCADMAMFSRAVAELDERLLKGVRMSSSRRAYAAHREEDAYDDDDELTMFSKDDEGSSVVSKMHSHLKYGMQLAALSPSSPSLSDSLTGENDVDAETRALLLSPREQYLAACIEKGLPPLPSLVMRKTFTTKIDLNHFGIGDDMGCAFAECLRSLPSVESLNLCDNALTDKSLYPLLLAIQEIDGLQELNLSRNKIDEQASEALAEYLKKPTCPLNRLVLISADVDDGECAAMVECLESNELLRELDLSNNLLGSAETIPGASTGGAALAGFISTQGCRLKSLKLAWNTIRGNSAVEFCRALGVNSTLVYLDLSYNGLGSQAGEVLGDSIIENRTLQTVLINNNNIGSTACVTLCIGICQNFAIKELSIDENPIGEAGARAVMQVPILIGNRVKLSAVNCNTVMRDESCWYDAANVCRSYSLDLSKPFERAIAFSVLQVVASHSTYITVKTSFQEAGAKAGTFGRKEELNLVQSIAKDKMLYFDDHQRALLQGLETLQAAASDEEKGRQLFEEADLDHGGDLDREELTIVMERLGLAEDVERMEDILALFDLDGTGVMQKEEFLDMIRHQSREAGQRIKELTEYPVLSLSGSGKRYIPPKQGMLHMSVVDGFVEKPNFAVMTSSDQSNALNMAISMGDSQLVQEAIRSSKIRFSEAEALFRRMYKETGNLASSVAKLLPQMKSGAEARQLVSKVTKDDRKLVGQIKQILGPASKTIFGLPNGFYVLDLSHEFHRICLSRLFEQNQRATYPRKSKCWLGFGKLGDTSQHNNWSCFRNERFNKEPIEITPERFTPMPRVGVLEFDFSGGPVPGLDDFAVPDSKFVNVLGNLFLLQSEEDKNSAMDQLEEWQRELWYDPIKAKKLKSDSSLKQKQAAFRAEGNMSVFETDRKRSQEMGLAGDKFYESLPERRNQLRESMKMEVIGVALGDEVPVEAEHIPGPPSSRAVSHMGSPIASSRKSTAASTPTASPVASPMQRHRKGVKTTDSKNGYTSPSSLSVLIEDKVTSTAPDHVAASSPPQLEPGGAMAPISKDPRVLTRLRLQSLAEHAEVNPEAKASRFAEIIEETFSNIWIDCRQLALLVVTLPCGNAVQTADFGSYACNLVVALFSRLVDVYNFELVMRELSSFDAACVMCRIGFLNIFNPCKPEGTLEMNLARYEERLVAKMLIYLSLLEPGNNMPQPFFKWKRELDPTPGFEVTAPWATEEGLPSKGNFGITFYSGEGRELEGCKAHPVARRGLMQLCAVDETLFERRHVVLEEMESSHTECSTDVRERNSAISLLKNDSNKDMFYKYVALHALKD